MSFEGDYIKKKIRNAFIVNHNCIQKLSAQINQVIFLISEIEKVTDKHKDMIIKTRKKRKLNTLYLSLKCKRQEPLYLALKPYFQYNSRCDTPKNPCWFDDSNRAWIYFSALLWQ